VAGQIFNQVDPWYNIAGVWALNKYNPKFGLGCNLDKDLSKDRRDNQLVKHKDIS